MYSWIRVYDTMFVIPYVDYDVEIYDRSTQMFTASII